MPTARIAANIPTLRNVSAQLSSAAEDLDALLPELRELAAAVRKEAASNTIDGNVSPIFAPLLSSFTAVCARVRAQLGQLHQNVTGDAAALKKLADDLESTDQHNAENLYHFD